MNKKILFVFSLLLLVSMVLNYPAKIMAQEATPESSMPIYNEVQAQEIKATEPAKFEYTLVYPGILPDNPLYILKATRDRLVSFLISDIQKKAEFNLLTSDKRVSSALILANRGKDELAVSSLSKSNNYMGLAIADARAARKMGKEVNGVLQNIKNSIKKHLEVAGTIKKRVDKKFRSAVLAEETRLVNFEKQVAKLLPQK